MRRIAILTQPLYLNYGGVLQAYALQRVLREWGYDVTTDSHRNSLARRVVPRWCRNAIGDFVRRAVNRLRGVTPHHALFEQVGGNFTRFIESHLSTVELFDRNGVVRSECKGLYDTYIVGSDQTWRESCNVGELMHYFLDFVAGEDVRRVSYAASFGVDNLSEYTSSQKHRAAELLTLFDAISLRESSGVRLCREEFGVEAQQVLDPTLLLRRGDYELLAQSVAQTNISLGCYILDRDPQREGWIKNLSQAMSVSSSDIGVGYSSVEGWIASFRDADYIVTDSFHGTIFAILFEKKFITMVNHERGASRFDSLLGGLGLDHRVVVEGSSVEDMRKLLCEDIDYGELSKKLDVMRAQSLLFLEKSLN